MRISKRKISETVFIFFLLTVFANTGCERLISVDVTDDGLPPAVPSGVQVLYAGEGEIYIDWLPNVEPDLKEYIVFRRTNKTNFIQIDRTKYSSYRDDSLSYNDIYYYKIAAVDNYGRQSELSTEVYDEPKNYKPPREPRFLTINGRNWEGSKSVYISWQPNIETDVEGYFIYRDTIAVFLADSSKFISFSQPAFYDDTSAKDFYTHYYYKVKAVDREGLTSKESAEVFDYILEIPNQIFPADASTIDYFLYFKIETISVPADYEIVLQNNPFYGEVWRKRISVSSINDTLRIQFDSYIMDLSSTYYWRVITYSQNNSLPNSISQLNSFNFK
jgi:hypothetical protein